MPGFLLLKVSSIMQSQKEIIFNYRKIPNISPGLIEVRKHILGGLYSGAYIRRAFCVSVRVSRPQIHCYISLLLAKKVFL